MLTADFHPRAEPVEYAEALPGKSTADLAISLKYLGYSGARNKRDSRR